MLLLVLFTILIQNILKKSTSTETNDTRNMIVKTKQVCFPNKLSLFVGFTLWINRKHAVKLLMAIRNHKDNPHHRSHTE